MNQDIEDICTAIRSLPLTAGRLTKLLGAVQGYAVEMSLYGDTTDVQNFLLDAHGASEDVRVYQGEESAA